MDQDRVRDAKLLNNLDETSVQFNKISRRRIRKGIGERERLLYSKTRLMKGTIGRIIEPPIVAASSETLKPVVVIQDKQ